MINYVHVERVWEYKYLGTAISKLIFDVNIKVYALNMSTDGLLSRSLYVNEIILPHLH